MRTRGQSLVLACMYLLVITLMVVMSLSLGMRVREKIETNTIAETSAYSNAVATARTYNAISYLNRAAIAHWINLAGVESLLSWTSLIFAQFSQLYEAVNPMRLQGTTDVGLWGALPPLSSGGQEIDVQNLANYNARDACNWVLAQMLRTAVIRAYQDMNIDIDVFRREAEDVGKQGRRLQSAIANIRDVEEGALGQLRSAVVNANLTEQVITVAGRPQGIASHAMSSANSSWLEGPQRGLNSDEVWWAVMDTRSAFVKSRNAHNHRFEEAVRRRLAEPFTGQPYEVIADVRSTGSDVFRVTASGGVDVSFNIRGHGCFGADLGSCESGPDWTNAIAQDITTVNVNFHTSNIKMVNQGSATGTTTQIDPETGEVVQVPVDPSSPSNPGGLFGGLFAGLFDALGRILSSGTCPNFTGHNSVTNDTSVLADDIHHSRDYADFDTVERTTPNFFLPEASAVANITMGPCTDDFFLRPCHTVYVGIIGLDTTQPLDGQALNYASVTRSNARHLAGSDPWDMRLRVGDRALDLRGGGQAASSLGTGLAYYHRPGAFTETPNLFNPYWRATMVGAERAGPGPAGLPAASAAVWSSLKAAGYQGER